MLIYPTLFNAVNFIKINLPEWTSDDIADVLIELTKAGKAHARLPAAYLPYASFTNFYVNRNYEAIIR